MKKRLSHILLFSLLLISVLFCFPVAAQAKTMGSMKKGITWDLMPGRTVTYYSYVGGAGYIKQKVTLTDAVTTKVSSDYARLTFTLKFKRTLKLSAKKIRKIANYYRKHPSVKFDPRCYFAVVDYNSGKCLLVDNPYNVTVSKPIWTNGDIKTYTAGNSVIGIRDCSVTVSVTYPISYTGMCIGAGGWTRIQQTSGDTKFWAGKVPFWKAVGKYSNKKKKVAHFVRYKY